MRGGPAHPWVLTPTTAAAADRQIVRGLRHVLEPDSVHEVAVAVTATPRAADGPASTADLAEAAMP